MGDVAIELENCEQDMYIGIVDFMIRRQIRVDVRHILGEGSDCYDPPIADKHMVLDLYLYPVCRVGVQLFGVQVEIVRLVECIEGHMVLHIECMLLSGGLDSEYAPFQNTQQSISSLSDVNRNARRKRNKGIIEEQSWFKLVQWLADCVEEELCQVLGAIWA